MPFVFADSSETPMLSVEITGVKSDLLNNIHQYLSILQYSLQYKKTSAQTIKPFSEKAIRRAHQQANKDIQQALRPFGFYQPSINSRLEKNNHQWQASYDIVLGQPVKVKDIDVRVEGDGQEEIKLLSLMANASINIGDTLSHSSYTQYKQALYDVLFEQGYLDVNYRKSELRVDINNHEAVIILYLNSGKKYYFGDLTIKQNIIHPEVIEPLVTIDKNTPFNTRHLLALQLKLTDTGYFSQTDIQVKRDQTVNQRIPVTIIANAAKKLKYSTSVGFGTDTGPRVGASVLNRRVNKRGHNLQYSTILSSVEKNLNVKYTIPMGNISSEYFDFSANANQETINETESTQYNVGASLNKNWWGGRRRLSLNLIQEEFSFDDEANNISLLLIPSFNYTRQKSDNSLFTRRGYSFSANIHGGLKSALSETTFFSTRLTGRLVLPISQNSRFLTRMELGAISTDQFDDLPPSERFFTGGSQSVRGYGYKDIGPTNSFDNNIGGQYLFSGSIEADYLAWGNSGLAVFYDTGDASSETLSLKRSLGIGFRYRSPIGMVRVDLAHPFDDPDDNYRLHISIGPDL